MKYFEDGDLTVGIQVASHPHGLETLEGDWHIVWGHVDGNERTTNYDEPNALNMMSLTVSQLEPADKRRKPMPDDDNIQIEFNFLKWGLTYHGRYGDVGGSVTNLRLISNTTPQSVEADDNAVLLLAHVRDDQDTPFISFATSAMDRSTGGLETLQNMEFVAKKTDPTGRHCLELTRNERLRLGYRWDSDGEFEDVNSSHDDVEAILAQPRRPGETNPALSGKVNKLVKELHRLNEKRLDIRRQVGMLRQRMVDELDDTALSPRQTPPQAKTASRRAGTSSGIKRTASGVAKPGSSTVTAAAAAAAAKASATAAKRTPRRAGATRRRGGGIGSRGGRRRRRNTTGTVKRASNNPNGRPPRASLAAAPTNGIAASADEADAGASSSDSDSSPEPEDGGSDFQIAAEGPESGVNGVAPATDEEGERKTGPKYRHCDLCACDVTKRNWNIHVNSQKHQSAVAGEPPSSATKRGGFGGKRPLVLEGEEATSPGGKRRNLASPVGRLQRPSSTTLRKEGGSVVDGAVQ